VDVSGLKQAQLELQELAKRLMEAQEAVHQTFGRRGGGNRPSAGGTGR
jgi:hypothetical protein